jgi:hypothetical protein
MKLFIAILFTMLGIVLALEIANFVGTLAFAIVRLLAACVFLGVCWWAIGKMQGRKT